MSVFIVLLLRELSKVFFINNSSKFGLFTFLAGIILTEFLLFGQGFLILAKLKPISNHNTLLLICSALLFFGIFLLFISQLFKQKATL
jgi:hypothetical protein